MDLPLAWVSWLELTAPFCDWVSCLLIWMVLLIWMDGKEAAMSRDIMPLFFLAAESQRHLAWDELDYDRRVQMSLRVEWQAMCRDIISLVHQNDSVDVFQGSVDVFFGSKRQARLTLQECCSTSQSCWRNCCTSRWNLSLDFSSLTQQSFSRPKIA